MFYLNLSQSCMYICLGSLYVSQGNSLVAALWYFGALMFALAAILAWRMR